MRTPEQTAKIITVICEEAPEIIEQDYDIKKGHCIAATAIGLEVFEHFKIDVRPLAIQVVAGNKEFEEWYGQGCPPMTVPVAVASKVRYVQIDVNEKRSGAYPGHLIINLIREGQIVDLSLGQFDHPEKDIKLPKVGLFPIGAAFWTGASGHFSHDGGLIIIRWLRDAPDWRDTPDWNRCDMNHEIAQTIIKAVEQKL